MKNKLPDLLTWLRIVLVPLVIVSFYSPTQWAGWIAGAFFIIAAVTDWLDGYLARKFKVESGFGAFLDPVADKLLVAMSLILLVMHYHTLLIFVASMIIIAREIIISALREWMAKAGVSAKVAVASIGKWKTGVQMTAISILIIFAHSDKSLVIVKLFYWLGLLLLVVATVLTVVSLVYYLKAAFYKPKSTG